MFQSGNSASIIIISLLWAFRFYSAFVVLAYARMVIRRHIAMGGGASGIGAALTTYASSTGEMAEDPFRKGTEAGEGWKGRIGRMLIGCGKGYWLGKDRGGAGGDGTGYFYDDSNDDLEAGASAWVHRFTKQFNHQSSTSLDYYSGAGGPMSSFDASNMAGGSGPSSSSSTSERERRRRSGTGPPPPKQVSAESISTTTTTTM